MNRDEAVSQPKTSPPISIECEDSAAPGLDWSIQVEFRPTSRGFSVWLFERNTNTTKPRWQRVRAVSQPLTWRAAAEVLANDDAPHVFGDLAYAVKVEGVTRTEAEILTCLFVRAVTLEENSSVVGEFLRHLSDSEIRKLRLKCGSFLAYAESPQPFFDLAKSLGFARPSVATKSDIGHAPISPAEPQRPAVALRVAPQATCARDNTGWTDSYVWPELTPENGATYARQLLDHPPPADGLRQAWERLHRFPSLSDEKLRAELLLRWCNSPLAEAVNGAWVSGDMLSTLLWLLRGAEVAVLFLLSAQAPHTTKEFVALVMRTGKSQAWHFEVPGRFTHVTGVWGRSFYVGWTKLALAVQAAADVVAIPVAEDLRLHRANLPEFSKYEKP